MAKKSSKKELSLEEKLENALVPVEEQPYKVPHNWVWVRLPFSYENTTSSSLKIKQKDYLLNGSYPIVDQGKSLVGGYSNEAKSLYSGELPIIVFGDHTRILKYIDFPFIQGADGVKLLKPKNFWSELYFYYALQNLDIKDLGYRRHFPIFPSLCLPLPPLQCCQLKPSAWKFWFISNFARTSIIPWKPSILWRGSSTFICPID